MILSFVQLDHHYHIVELYGNIPTNVVEWCIAQYGNQGSRWWIKYDRIYFKNAKDHLLFVLKWS